MKEISASRDLEDLRASFSDIRELLHPERASVITMILISVPGGILSAVLMALVAKTAVALAAGAEQVTVAAASLSVAMTVPQAIALAGAVAVVLILLGTVSAYIPAWVAANTQARLRDELFGLFVHASWDVQSRERRGQLQEVMMGMVAHTANLLIAVMRGLGSLVIFLGLVASAFLIAPVAAAVVGGIGVLMFAVFRPLAQRSHRQSRLHAGASVDLAAEVNESVQLGEEYQVFDRADVQEALMSATIESVRRPFMRAKTLTSLVGGIYANAVLLLLVIGLGAIYLVGVSDLGAVGAVVLILMRAMMSGQTVQHSYTQVRNHLPYFERVIDARDAYRASEVPVGDTPLETIRSFAFDGVSYSYGEETQALRDVSFDVTAGTAVGVIGPSGAGKSTMVQILLRLRVPDRGTYLVNGRDAMVYGRADWARAITYVPQQPKLLLGSVADNIRFHRPGLSDEDVERAARLAHIHDEIAALPGGYARMIGQGAAAVSGGQTQRLVLARALVTDPQVIILDEPTSALDPRSEALVQQSLEELRDRGVTFFIVAHRPATLEFIDQLLVLDRGELVAQGPPDVVARESSFAREALEQIQRDGPDRVSADRSEMPRL